MSSGSPAGPARDRRPGAGGRLASVVDAGLEWSILGSFGSPGIRLRRRSARWPEHAATDSGRAVLVTGASRGIGRAAARLLLTAGATVRATVRDPAAIATSRAAILADLPGGLADDAASRLFMHVLDLDVLAAVRTLAEELAGPHGPDVIIHNAGAMHPTREVTVDGFERTYQVHVVAPFLLTALLLPTLRDRSDPRVVTVTSGGMYVEPLVVRRLESPGSYRPAVAYARAKRAQVELNVELDRRLGRTSGVAFHVMHPGWVRTDGLRTSLPGFARLARPILRTPAEGADTAVMLALAPRGGPGSDGGELWLDREVRPTSRLRRTVCDPSERDLLWQRVATDAGLDPASLQEPG
jgi:dehydrogenase/reductase SDR family member 12